MGARLVGEVMAYQVEVPLNFNEYRLLVAMALTALDGAPDDDRAARRYFDSREAMSLALGRRVPDSGAGGNAERERAAAFEAVRVALSGLVELGAVKRLKSGRAGQRAEFLVVLDVLATRSTAEFARRRRAQQSRPTPPVQTQAQPGAVSQVEPGAVSQVEPGVQGQAQPGPKEPLRNHRGKTAGNTSPNSTASPGPVDNKTTAGAKAKERAA